jgi:tRNA-2-methylthio-N6-dimethylallyladenosine synthase
VITTVVTGAKPHYLLADRAPTTVRRTRAGDAWEARLADRAVGAGPGASVLTGSPVLADSPVLLGMPSRRSAG